MARLLMARWLVGSHAYGVANHRSDRDYVSVWLETQEQVLGLHHTGTVQTTSQTTDETHYPFREWVRLVGQGNPNMVETLFLRPDYVAPWWAPQSRAALHTALLSSQALKRFAGYGRSQIAALEGRRNKKTNRPEVIAQYGWDTKWGYHAIRVLSEGLELAQTGRLVFPRPNADLLSAIREGRCTQKAVTTYAEHLATALEATNTRLPEQPDWARINTNMIDTFYQGWDSQPHLRRTS